MDTLFTGSRYMKAWQQQLPQQWRQKSQISLYDMSDKVHISGITTAITYNMDVIKLPTGIYIVQIITDGKKTIR
ncbi:T9SS type A sorting domain-containing protein [Chitinophaga pinensis]|nr:T9SS type A sorting domain-containing protein [Chitinophaga pinensis]